MTSKIWRPRMAAALYVPLSGAAGDKARQDKDPDADSSTLVPIRIRRASLDLNDHNHADALKIQAEWQDAGIFDPRLLSGASIEFYMGNADVYGAWPLDQTTPRFTGVITRAQRQAREDEGFVVDLEFLDYTTLFLKAKPFPPAGVPDMSQTLDEAWGRICDHVGSLDPDNPGKIISSVKALRNSLSLYGLSTFPRLSSACATRFAKLSKVPLPHPDADAWAVWQQCCGMLGLISYVRRNEVVVTTSTAYYNVTDDDPPKMVWAKNVLAWQEARQVGSIGGQGVCATSFNPLTGTTLEALYPPIGDPRVKHKKLSAKKLGDAGALRTASDYYYVSTPSITTQAALTRHAERVYEERSRQELEGTIRTVEMAVDTVDGVSFDLLDLAAGDFVRIEFDQLAREIFANVAPGLRRIALLQNGYSEAAADVISRSYGDLAQLQPIFLAKCVRVEVDEESFDLTINYINRIQVSGDTDS